MAKFKPGQSGNPGGRPKKQWTWAGLLREAMEQQNLDGEHIKEEVARVLVAKAAEGDVQALKELGNRLDGLPKQSIEHSGDAEFPLTIRIVEEKRPDED